MFKSEIEGRVGGDPELKKTDTGRSWLSFNVAHHWKAKGTEQVEWLKCTVWGDQANEVKGIVRKGDLITLTGTVTTSLWTTNDNQTRKDVCVNVKTLTPMIYNEERKRYELGDVTEIESSFPKTEAPVVAQPAPPSEPEPAPPEEDEEFDHDALPF